MIPNLTHPMRMATTASTACLHRGDLQPFSDEPYEENKQKDDRGESCDASPQKTSRSWFSLQGFCCAGREKTEKPKARDLAYLVALDNTDEFNRIQRSRAEAVQGLERKE